MNGKKETGDDTQTRRRFSEEEIEIIKSQLLESIYADIGKSVVKKILWVGGAVVIAAFAWLIGAGQIKIGG